MKQLINQGPLSKLSNRNCIRYICKTLSLSIYLSITHFIIECKIWEEMKQERNVANCESETFVEISESSTIM